VGLAVSWKSLKSGAFARLWKTPPFMGNAENVVVRGSNSLTTNIALSETVREFSAFV
jgi:hypothetical protein